MKKEKKLYIRRLLIQYQRELIEDLTHWMSEETSNPVVGWQNHFQRLAEVSKDSAAVNAAREAVLLATRDLVSGEETLRNEISNHYLDGLKYGMAGSDGSIFSNYVRYMRNNHDALGICCADEGNPMNRTRKLLFLWNTVSLTFLLSCLLELAQIGSSLAEGLIVAVIVAPYSFVIYNTASCRLCHRKNVCVKWSHRLGSILLAFFSVSCFVYVGGGVAILVLSHQNYQRMILTFITSLLLEQLMPFYFGILNWVFLSWKGFLFCPQCGCTCCGRRFTSKRFCPILGCFPISMILNAFHMGESTYYEDKLEFQEKYPGRIAIDSRPGGAVGGESKGESAASSHHTSGGLESSSSRRSVVSV